MLKLSKRLQAIADYVSPGSRVADIGSDHALLPVYLIQSGRVPTAIAGELNPGPYEAARRQTADAGLTTKLQVRRGDGLSVLEPGEADTVTIAGMGGSLMSSILEEGYLAGKLNGVKELVLQPNVGEEFVRSWLLKRGWFLAEETILEEDDKIYEVLHAFKYEEDEAKKRNEGVYEASFLTLPTYKDKGAAILEKMGPHLLRAPQEVFFKKWKLELEKMSRIVTQMSQSDQAEQKKQQFRDEMNVIEEVLQCLQTGKPSSK
ncbi:tRNA (adenine(22)-N(1))-methyltransferase [Paenibacillus glycanilyticus]|uniref:tRNA (Adenine(22)-N(1))-methyltransferase n=1 Tax=Paenibacillus glycanilyticus TaxID=126569 RepID=A0ABQ6GES1_9BACL|nr:class I SAM-dependent methyltransferase [Paenibacillus glycanilyticus]GLX69147.1 tRNA (adenine(22)-N(1))-methyltransferase [Paenibacillus glycanilyticus]